MLLTVAALSEAPNIFDWKLRSWFRIPLRSWICPRLFCIFVIRCRQRPYDGRSLKERRRRRRRMIMVTLCNNFKNGSNKKNSWLLVQFYLRTPRERERSANSCTNLHSILGLYYHVSRCLNKTLTRELDRHIYNKLVGFLISAWNSSLFIITIFRRYLSSETLWVNLLHIFILRLCCTFWFHLFSSFCFHIYSRSVCQQVFL
jgi:hypothetical protein